MRATAFLRRNPIEVAWAVFAIANVAAMDLAPKWETIPFHFVWVSLTIVYGLRTWRPPATYAVLGVVAWVTGVPILIDAIDGTQLWGELFEVPLMSLMFLAMVWHARRRQEALRAVEHLAAQRADLLARQEAFLDDASHELRTPVTIARGHLEALSAERNGDAGPALDVALDELARIERIVERLLLLAKAGQPGSVAGGEVELEPFLEDVFMRWAEIAPRTWRLGAIAPGSLAVDPDGLRVALDALLENAVKYSDAADNIELRAVARAPGIVIEVADGGSGVPPDALGRIFDRFARADRARTRAPDGVGLGLAIVDAIAKAHGGRCAVRSSAAGSTFSLSLPGFRPAARTAAGAKLLPALPTGL